MDNNSNGNLMCPSCSKFNQCGVVGYDDWQEMYGDEMLPIARVAKTEIAQALIKLERSNFDTEVMAQTALSLVGLGMYLMARHLGQANLPYDLPKEIAATPLPDLESESKVDESSESTAVTLAKKLGIVGSDWQPTPPPVTEQEFKAMAAEAGIANSESVSPPWESFLKVNGLMHEYTTDEVREVLKDFADAEKLALISKIPLDEPASVI